MIDNGGGGAGSKGVNSRDQRELIYFRDINDAGSELLVESLIPSKWSTHLVISVIFGRTKGVRGPRDRPAWLASPGLQGFESPGQIGGATVPRSCFFSGSLLLQPSQLGS